MTTEKIILLFTSLIIFGESLGLLIGTAFIIKPRPEWLSQKNFAFILDDMFFGLLLTLVAFSVITKPWIFWFSLTCTFLSHAWRDAEFVAKFPNRFCDNFALFFMNNFKLVGLVSVILF